MSVTGMWIVGAIPNRDADSLLTDFSNVLGEAAALTTPDYAKALAWWTGGGDKEPFFGTTVPGRPWERDTDAADRLVELLDGANPETEAGEAVWDACVALMSDKVEGGVFVASARKASPLAALCYALGAASMAMLPGRFGSFLLPHDNVVATLARAEQALDLSGTRREQAVERIRTWMTEMGDAPGFDAEELLDGPLRVLRHAASAGCGAAAFSRWY